MLVPRLSLFYEFIVGEHNFMDILVSPRNFSGFCNYSILSFHRKLCPSSLSSLKTSHSQSTITKISSIA